MADLPASPPEHQTQADLRSYIWARLKRGKQKFGDTLMSMASMKNPDARIILAVLDRVDPKPKYSSQMLPVPIDLQILTPEQVEHTRQLIMTEVGAQRLSVDMANAVMELINAAGDRSIARELADMLAMAQELRDARMDKNKPPAPAAGIDDDVIGIDADGNEVKRPKWGRPKLVSDAGAAANALAKLSVDPD